RAGVVAQRVVDALLDDHPVTGPQQRAQGEGDGLAGAVGDQHPLGVTARVPVGDRLPDARAALGDAVVHDDGVQVFGRDATQLPYLGEGVRVHAAGADVVEVGAQVPAVPLLQHRGLLTRRMQ